MYVIVRVTGCMCDYVAVATTIMTLMMSIIRMCAFVYIYYKNLQEGTNTAKNFVYTKFLISHKNKTRTMNCITQIEIEIILNALCYFPLR